MRTRTQSKPQIPQIPQISPATTRTTRSTNNSSPSKPNSITPGKFTHSFSSSNYHESDQVSSRWVNERVFVVTGLDPDLLQAYDADDQKRNLQKPVSPADQRAERRARRESAHEAIIGGFLPNQNGQQKRKRDSEDASIDHVNSHHGEPPSKTLRHHDDQQSFRSTQDEIHESENDSMMKDAEGEDDDQVQDSYQPATRASTVSKRGGTMKRRRRGGAQLASRQPSRELTPEPTPLGPEEDTLSDVDLPSPFTDEIFDDPNLPDDEAQDLYNKLYKPMTQPNVFITPLTKFLPGQRSNGNLYALAANTAAALRAWQDEYLELEKITAPHAAIPRKPATGQRNPIEAEIYEDQKEADLYDYLFDPKKVGMQDPLAQRVVRDASGRELRTRQPRGQSTQVNNNNNNNAAVATAVPEELPTGRRTRRPVAKYDGLSSETGRKRGAGAMSETPEAEPVAKRGRMTGRGRGGRGRGGRGRGGRGGGLLGKRIQQMRAESAVASVATSEDDMSGSENGSVPPETREESVGADATPTAGNTPAPESPLEAESGENGPSLTASGKKKGRPKGSKNHHKRSDAGIPKGPRVPKPNTTTATTTAVPSPVPGSTPGSSATPSAAPSVDPKRKVPRSEKRSKSMVEWWARRKAKEAEDKAREAELQAQDRQRAAEAHARYMSHHGIVQQQQQHPQHPQQHQHQHQQPQGFAYTGPYPPPHSGMGALPPPQHAPLPPPPQQQQQVWGVPPPHHGQPQHPQHPQFMQRQDVWMHGVPPPLPPLPPPPQQQQQGQPQPQHGQHGEGLRRDQHGFVRSF